MILTEINIYGGDFAEYESSNYNLESKELILVSLDGTVLKYSEVQDADHTAFKANPTQNAAASIFENHPVESLEDLRARTVEKPSDAPSE